MLIVLMATESSPMEIKGEVEERKSSAVDNLHELIDFHKQPKVWLMYLTASLHSLLKHFLSAFSKLILLSVSLHTLSSDFKSMWLMRLMYHKEHYFQLDTFIWPPNTNSTFQEKRPVGTLSFGIGSPDTSMCCMIYLSFLMEKRLALHLTLHKVHFRGNQENWACDYGYLLLGEVFSNKSSSQWKNSPNGHKEGNTLRFCGIHSDGHVFLNINKILVVYYLQMHPNTAQKSVLHFSVLDRHMLQTSVLSAQNLFDKKSKPQTFPTSWLLSRPEWVFYIFQKQFYVHFYSLVAEKHLQLQVTVSNVNKHLYKVFDGPEIFCDQLKPNDPSSQTLEYLLSTFQSIILATNTETKVLESLFFNSFVAPHNMYIELKKSTVLTFPNVKCFLFTFCKVQVKTSGGQFIVAGISQIKFDGKLCEKCKYGGISFLNYGIQKPILFETYCTQMYSELQYRKFYSRLPMLLLVWYSYQKLISDFHLVLHLKTINCIGVTVNACSYLPQPHFRQIRLAVKKGKCAVIQVHRHMEGVLVTITVEWK